MAERPEHRLLYETWVRLHAHELYGFAYRMSGDHVLAEDLVQECFAEAWRSMASLRDPERARSWLFQILRHRCSRHFQRDQRQQQLHGSVTLPLDTDQHSPVQAGDLVKLLGDREAIQIALNELSVDLRQTFLMVAVEELTCRETAEQLKIPLGTVLSRLDRARRSLRGTILRTTAHKGERRATPAANPSANGATINQVGIMKVKR